MNTINTIKVWGTTYTLGNYPAEVMTTIQGETAMLDTAAAITEIIKGYTNFTARREVSPLFPFSTISDAHAANRLIGDCFFNPLAMQELGCEIESSLYAGTLFITSEKSQDGKGRHYAVRYIVPTGMVFTLDGASGLDTIDQAREIASAVGNALRESDLLTK